MFYLYYNEEGVVTGVSNTNTEPGEHIEISEDMFMDFNEGKLDMLNFIVVENNLVEKQEQPNEEFASKVFLSTHAKDNSISIIQQKNNWKIQENLNDITKLNLRSMQDHVKCIFVVDKTNHNLLHEILVIPVKQILDSPMIIKKNSKSNNVRLVCKQGLEEYIHIQEL